jgi:hypothetical protein
MPASLRLTNTMTRLVGGQGVSIKALTNLLSEVGVPFRGQPGKTPKDYSREYGLKAILSWRGVAERTLENDPETRQEFGGRTYAALTFEEKEHLKHRIREGVRSYAKRTGKPFPVPRQVSK